MPHVDCVFCQIVAGAVPSDRVAENEHAVAFRDLDPQAPTHVLVVPREHYDDVGAATQAAPALVAEVYTLAAKVATQEGLTDHRMVTNTGAGAGQSVMHMHVHVLGGRSMGWPPG